MYIQTCNETLIKALDANAGRTSCTSLVYGYMRLVR